MGRDDFGSFLRWIDVGGKTQIGETSDVHYQLSRLHVVEISLLAVIILFKMVVVANILDS